MTLLEYFCKKEGHGQEASIEFIEEANKEVRS